MDESTAKFQITTVALEWPLNINLRHNYRREKFRVSITIAAINEKQIGQIKTN